MSSKRLTVLLTRELAPVAVKLLETHCEVVVWPAWKRPYDLNILQTCDAVICCPYDGTGDILPFAGSNLKVIATFSVGYDHIDVKECRKRGILLAYTPDVLTEPSAELTVALLLATSRNIFRANKAIFNGSWGPWDPLWMCGQGIIGNVVGIVGLGRIGLSVAEKLIPFKPKSILYHNRNASSKGDALGAQLVSLPQLLRESDFVIVLCALSHSTQQMFNAELFGLMKPNAIFINTSRGAVIDQEALYVALTSGQISAAGIDVCTPEPIPTDHKLLQLPNLTILPHIAGCTTECREGMSLLAAENVIAALQGRPLPTPIP